MHINKYAWSEHENNYLIQQIFFKLRTQIYGKFVCCCLNLQKTETSNLFLKHIPCILIFFQYSCKLFS